MVAMFREQSLRFVVLRCLQIFSVLILSLSAIVGCSESETDAAQEASAVEMDQPAVGVAAAAQEAKLAEAVAGSHRTPANVERDKYRHPVEVLEFFGIRPEMTVVEMWAEGGWWTEILAPYLRDEGAFYIAEMPAQQNETLNVVEIVKLALDIFNEHYIHFISEKEEIIAKLDRTQLIRVVTNLVKNAIQALPDVESPRILVSVGNDGDFVKISVADNGIGIEDGFKDKVFEPKFTTKSSGMGLGLGMVKTIVETYKGSIDFTSQPGKGTVFTVRFPKETS